MCFNKSSSSSPTSTSTITRDERIGLEGGGSALVMKDLVGNMGHNATVAVSITDTSPQVLAEGFDYAGAVAGEMAHVAQGVVDAGYAAFGDVIDFADRVALRGEQAYSAALQFAGDTQAAYQVAAQSAATQDATEMAQMMVKYTTLAVVAFFAFQIFGKGI